MLRSLRSRPVSALFLPLAFTLAASCQSSRAPAPPPARAAVSTAVASAPSPPSSLGSWPSFRGPGASGVAEGQGLPDAWSAAGRENLAWSVEVPGLAHSSPIVWGDRLFVTTAVNPEGNPEFRPGLYGDGTGAADISLAHKFEVLAFDKKSGRLLWQQTAFDGVPRAGRHIKSTYANPTPSTNGKVLLAYFCSEGLYAYSLDGKLLWQKDLGVVDNGAYNFPGLHWGCASSPLLWHDKVFVQVDSSGDDFLVALDAQSGRELWRVARDEMPSWASPNLFEGPSGAELVTNAPNRIRGYDPETGQELWQLGPSSDITAPTPVFTRDRIVVASGRRPVKPIYVLRPGSRGDLTLPEGQASSAQVLWSKLGKGPYMPTPLAYGPYLYTLSNDGFLDCYELESGAEIYRERI
nr:PQQ-binding-like beta-propeller repeat protein [Thermoanaerobaculia bacterium]